MKRAEKKLVELYFRNGCIRSPNEVRVGQDGHRKYKKGYEIRWTAKDEAEEKMIKNLLSRAGFTAGKPYFKRSQTILPVYGKAAFLRFQKLLSDY